MNTVLSRPEQQEVTCRLGGAIDLGTNPGVVGGERAVRQRWPVPTDLRIEGVRAARVDLEVGGCLGVHPLNVGAKAAAACQVNCRMDTEASLLRERIHEAMKGTRLPAQRKVIALGVVR